MRVTACLIALFWTAFLAAPAISQPAIEPKLIEKGNTLKEQSLNISNVKDGEERRYPVILLRGSVRSATAVTVFNRSDKRIRRANRVPVVNGQFKGLVELVPGDNNVVVEAGDEQIVRLVRYRKMTTPFKVEVVYITAKDGDTKYLTQLDNDKQDYRDKLDTAVKLFQSLTAEQMNAAGFGYRTFAADYDDDGKVVVHVRKYPESAERLRREESLGLYEKFRVWLDNDFPRTRYKTIAITAFTGYDSEKFTPLGHASLGREPLALFSCNGMCSWPSDIAEVSRCFNDTTPVDTSKLWDDSNYRGQLWALASTTLGATLHELGHTFGLLHYEDNDPMSIMVRGGDHINRFFCLTEPSYDAAGIRVVSDSQAARWGADSVGVFNQSRWFRPDDSPVSAETNEPLTITNLKDGEERCYPLILVRGTAGGVTTVSAVNKIAREPVPRNEVPVVNGKYKLLVELAPGDNLLQVTAGEQQLECHVKYKVSAARHKVSIVYITSSDGNTKYLTQVKGDKQNFKEKLDTATKLMQSFVAETMAQAGYGHKTFAVDYDEQGKVVVDVIKCPESAANLRKLDSDNLYKQLQRRLVRTYPPENYKVFATLAFTGYDNKTQQLLGNIVNAEDSVAVFSCNGMCSWPDSISDVARAFTNTKPVNTAKIWDDTNGRPELWALASTTIGVRVFQLGQTLELKEQSKDFDIMWRGFDHFNRVFMPTESWGHPDLLSVVEDSEMPTWNQEAAEMLAQSPWFQSED